MAPARELAQVQAAVPGQEPGEGEPFGFGKGGLDRGERSGLAAMVIGHLPAGLEPEGWARSGPGSSTETQHKPSGLVTPCTNKGALQHVRPSQKYSGSPNRYAPW
jgi:hypothetical protein